MLNLNPNILDAIVNTGIKHNLNKIILFGSRARGDNSDRSDIDLAVQGGDIEVFESVIDCSCPTLLCFDIVNLDKPVQDSLLKSIVDEGVVIYEKIQ